MSISDEVCKVFDINMDKVNEYVIKDLPILPDDFGILLIVGSSGGGKTSMLRKHFGYVEDNIFNWTNNPICEHFKDIEDAKSRLGAVGLNSIPSWLKPYNNLSNGEKFRANLAITINSGAVIDEFTSVVDRTVAKSTCVSIRKYIDNNGIKNIVLASCHRDIVEWLQPDYVFDVDSETLTERRSLRLRPSITLSIRELGTSEKSKVWEIFRRHHYLDEKLNKSARCWVFYFEDTLIAFSSSLSMPSGSLKNAWRGHRTVVLPDFQGMGIGTRVSDYTGELHLSEGKRYFSKTTHYRLGEYREKSPLWKPTSKNRVDRKDVRLNKKPLYNNYKADGNRICYSHEYIGKPSKGTND